MSKETFTKQQLDDWESFESVRRDGLFNMLDPRARMAAGLDKEEHLFCIKHYSALKAAAEAKKAGEPK